MSFKNISDDIISSPKFKSLDLDYHHGLTRYKHIMHVAKGTYYISKFLRLDYVSATRGALLHDYFNESEYLDKKGLEMPFLALNNSMKEYNLNIKEKNIIISHMYPIGLIKPEYIEAWIVSLVDKSVATYEYINYKFRDKFRLGFIFIINFLSMKL